VSSTFHQYPGTKHWFFEADRTDSFEPKAAELAWKRTLRFLRVSLPTSKARGNAVGAAQHPQHAADDASRLS
jgi:hypothetical protein